MKKGTAWLHTLLSLALGAGIAGVVVVAVHLLAGCNQPITRIRPQNGVDNPLSVKCFRVWCDRRSEACRSPTSDYPDGYCVYAGDDGRAFGSRSDAGSDAKAE